jgi:hypothetical protein
MATITNPSNTNRNASRALEDLEAKSVDVLAGLESNVQPNGDGTVTVEFAEPEALGYTGMYEEDGHYANLVQYFTDEELQELAATVCANVSQDEAAREDWLRTIEFGLDLLGVKVEEKNTPFEGACSAQHPLLMESAVKFQSKASNELLPAQGPVKARIMGDVTPEKEDQANRVKAHMNYQITEEMTEFYTDSERMLLYVPLVGSGFKKTYYSAHLERGCSEFVPADQFIVPNSASDLYRADRYTHILYKTDYEFEADCSANLYSMPKDGLGIPSEPKLTDVQRKTHSLIGIKVGLGERDKVFTLYEQHIMLHLPQVDDSPDKKYKLASPYIVTVDAASTKVVGIRRNWKEGDPKRKKKVIFTHYGFVPSFNFYHFGYLHLLGNLQLSLTAALRSLVDAGQFATLQGGFKLKGVRIVDDGTPIHPGQFKEIETSIMDINKAIMTLPFKEPSNVLFQMLNFLDTKGQKFADSTEQVIADATNYGPVGTTMALLDASTKFFSAIHKRLHNSLKQELRLIAEINSETLPDNMKYNLENKTMAVSRADYDERVDVIPVSDPNVSSNAHRLAKAQTLYQMALQSPDIHDMREVLKHVYTNFDYVNIDRILPKPEEAQPNDPITDLSLAQQGKPIKAFEGQDHQSHIILKQAFLQDPKSGANPMMQKAARAIAANIQEHMLMSFVEQTKALSQGQENALPQAAQQLAQMNVQKLKQETEGQGGDPAAMMLAQAELLDTKTQAQKNKTDTILKTAELTLRKEQLDLAKSKEMARQKEVDKKAAAELDKLVTTKGLDAILEGMRKTTPK